MYILITYNKNSTFEQNYLISHVFHEYITQFCKCGIHFRIITHYTGKKKSMVEQFISSTKY